VFEMTRINTNVSSLVAQNTLGQSNADLNQALTRLSTGLRINTGKDDPAGLIASENLRSDITSIRRAISNTDRANQVIATADSALGQVSSLLNDIRGLVTESANSGALSDDQISANQLQLDSSLEALNRIAQTTTFQGRRLLDGSLDFITTAGTGFTNLNDLKIDQANLGANGQINVDVAVSTAATQAQIDIANIPNTQTPATGSVNFDIETIAAVGSTGTANFSIETTAEQQATGTVTFGTSTTVTFDITAVAGQAAAGAAGAANSGVDVIFTNNDDDSGNVSTVNYNAGANTLTIDADFDNATPAGNPGVTATQIAAAIDASGEFATSSVTNGGNNLIAADSTTYSDVTTGGAAAVNTTETIDVVGTLTAGASGDVGISYAEAALGAGNPTTNVIGDAGSGYTVQINSDTVGGVNIDDVRAAVQSIAEVSTATFNGTPGNSVYNAPADTVPGTTSLAGGVDQVITTETIDITSVAGATGNVNISFAEADLSGNGTNVTGNASSGYTLTIDSTIGVGIGAIRSAIAGIAEIDTAVFNGTPGTSTYNAAIDTSPATVTQTGGADNGITDDLVLELSGSSGAEVLSFEAGTSIVQLINGINLVSDATGVSAVESTITSGTLELTSTEYGSNSVVDIKVISEGSPTGVFTTAVGQGARQTGADVIASVNGVSATGNGNSLSINTATLDLSTTVEAGITGTINFNIIGGGALFQLGPDVVSNQQARLGVGSVNTARLGGVSGRLFQLGTGGSAALTTNPNAGAKIVEQAIDQVTSLRGRLGAFQRTTLETNKNALNDTLVNLSEAESSIRDADFAAESAALTRAQILVQSGTTVLQIANQNPQNVLALLR
jgi:flagellin